jgi:outer membrane cobalamin receptor
MKVRSISLSLCLVCCASLLSAAETNQPPQKALSATDSNKSVGSTQTNAVLTGSYIKRPIKRNGQITDGPSQVIVVDSNAIERSGARDLKQLLIQQGVNH